MVNSTRRFVVWLSECHFVLVASGPRVKLAGCESALNPLVVCSTDRSKAVVLVLVLLFVALWFILRGDLLYVFPCVISFLCFSVLLELRLPRLGKRELILVLFVRLFGLCLFRFAGFLFLLGSGKGCDLWMWHSLDFSLTFFSVLLVLRLPRLWKRELILVFFVRLFYLCLFVFVGFLFLLGSGKGCGLWFWHSPDFSYLFSQGVFEILSQTQCLVRTKYSISLKTLLQQGISEPEFYGDLVYRFKKKCR